MKQFLVLFREPDGRKDEHTAEDIQQHREHWNAWMTKIIAGNILLGGAPLTLNGAVIKDGMVFNGPYTRSDDEIAGGYLLIQDTNIDAAIETIKGCPVFDFGGFAEIRECMQQKA
ncbi:MAG TPA: hypothetical protein VG738_05905 [Chitinophagaceae bacterium]|nr:hypothetical protein [Chitinophagaceae bacterium]